MTIPPELAAAMDSLNFIGGRTVWYARDGRPITWAQQVELNRDEVYRRIGYTRVADGVWVSTVWLGIDMTFGLGPEPLIFETMVFAEVSDDGLDEGTEQLRWSTFEKAVLGHHRVVSDLLGALLLDGPIEEFVTQEEP